MQIMSLIVFLSRIPKFSLNATPDISLLYNEIAKLHNLKN